MHPYSYDPVPKNLRSFIYQRRYLTYQSHCRLDLHAACWFNSHSEGPIPLVEVIALVEQDPRQAREYHVQGLVHFTYSALCHFMSRP